MKIALLAPPWLPLPPNGYGGIESIVYHLAEGLTKKGHEVIVAATGDSTISGKLQFLYEKSLGIDTILEKGHALLFLNHIYHSLKYFPKDIDIIHNHCEYYAMHLLDSQPIPFIHTLHGSFHQSPIQSSTSIKAYIETLTQFKHHPFVSISDFQRQGKTDLNYIKTVYNGIDVEHIPVTETPSDYMAWLGRYSPIKGLDQAIAAAKQTHQKLRISVSIHQQRQEQFNQTIWPSVDNTNIILMNQLTDLSEKNTFLGQAKLFLFPIQWEEPFGLVMIEAMATGTPVVAFARGSVPEIVKDGETGFLVNPSDNDIRGEFVIKETGILGICKAIERMYELSSFEYQAMRKKSRAHIEQHFSTQRMIDNYEELYRNMLKR